MFNNSPRGQNNELAAGFAQLEAMIPGLAEIDQRYGFSSRCAASIIEEVRRNSGASPSVVSSAIAHASEPLSYLAIYDKLSSQGFIDRPGTRRILDLGCGYRISSIAYELLFPALEKSIGIDWSEKKASSETAFRAYKLTREKFETRIGSFYSLSDTALWENTAGSQYAFLQSFHDAHADRSKDLPLFLRHVGSLLAPDGALIATIDRQDINVYEYRASVQLAGILAGLPGASRFSMLRMVPCGHFGMNHDTEVEVFVVPKNSLLMLRGI